MILQPQLKEDNMGTELETIQNSVSISDISLDDTAALLAALGQDGDSDKKSKSLPSLRINYDADTATGHSLKRGSWKIKQGDDFVYAEEVFITPMMRTFEWSIYDQEEGAFTSRSVQRMKLTDQFPDNTGGMKCGRMTKAEEESLPNDDARVLLSKSATCNVILYGVVDIPNGTYEDGSPAVVEKMPFIGYFKRSGFRPVNDFIVDKLGKKIPLPTAYISMKTKRNSNGGVTYWTPKLELVKEVSFTPESKELVQKFFDTVQAGNTYIVNEHKDALKKNLDASDEALSGRFAS